MSEISFYLKDILGATTSMTVLVIKKHLVLQTKVK
jgi:hypothetical protein